MDDASDYSVVIDEADSKGKLVVTGVLSRGVVTLFQSFGDDLCNIMLSDR